MTADSLYRDILAEIKEIPILDVHSHISTDCPQAKNLSDILFYHFVRREVYSAGLPDDNFLVSQAPLGERIARFLPYLEHIEHTTTFWCVRKIIKDIYGIPEGINRHNWQEVEKKIKERGDNNSWSKKIMAKAGIERSLTCEGNWNKENPGKHPFLSPLFENLEDFNFDPERGTSVLNLVKNQFGYLPSVASEFEDLLAKFFQKKIKSGINYFVCFISTALQLLGAKRTKIKELYQARIAGKKLSFEEENILITWLLHTYLEIMRELRRPIQLCIGAWWAKPKLRYGESYVFSDHRFVFSLIPLFKTFPEVKINIMCAAYSLSQELTIISRMLPNISLLGFWWHTLFPTYVKTTIAERLEALPANKWIAVGTDAYSVEWAYAKVSLILDCLARVLSEKIEQGYLSRRKALWLARRILYDNPKEIYGL